MKKIDFPLIADTLFYTAAIFLLGLGLLRFCGVPFGVSLPCAILLGLAAGAICFFFSFLSHNRRAVSKKERDERDALMLHLALENSERVRALLLESFKAVGKEAYLKGDDVFCDGKTVIPIFCMEPVSADAAANVLKKYREEPFCIACKNVTPEAEKLLLSFGKETMRENDVYEVVKTGGCYPEKLICCDIPRKTVKTRLRVAFSKKYARPFFVSGLLLLIMSLFVLFPVYYLITGAALMITAVLVRAVGYA